MEAWRISGNKRRQGVSHYYERAFSLIHSQANGRGLIPATFLAKGKRIFIFSLLIALSLPFAHAHAGEIVHPYELVDPPVQVHDNKRIEVIEWFWYASPAGHELSSMLAEWVKQLPEDVVLHRMPAILEDDWAILANVYLAFEQLGITEKMHARMHHAVVKQGLNWVDERFIFDWVDRQGVDVAAFAAAFRSDAVYEKRLQAARLGKSIHLKNVPAFLVQGTYLVTEELAGGIEHIPGILDQAIEQARRDLLHLNQ